MATYKKDKQYVKFCAYGFLKNLRFFDIILLLFFLDNGITFTQIGVLYALREIIINLFEIPSGIVADTFGRKNALITAFAAYIISFIVFFYSSQFPLLLVGMSLSGVGDAFRSGSHKGMIMDYLALNNWSAHKVDYYGHTRSWSQRGSALSSLIAGFIVLYSGSYRIIFLLALIPYIVNTFNILSYPNELNFSSQRSDHKNKKSIVAVYQDFLQAIKSASVLRVINSSALHSAYLKSIKDYIQPIMVQVALLIPIMTTMDTKRKSGIIVGIIYFFIYLLTAQASKHSVKLLDLNIKNIPTATLISGLGAGLLCGIIVYFEIWVAALILFIVIYLVENARKPILTGLLADEVPNKILTSVFSAQSFYSTITTSVIAIALGIIADFLGLGWSLFIISGVLIVFTFLLEISKSRDS